MKDNYEDIINLNYQISSKHPRMSMQARAAQFAPFAALTGCGNEVAETARFVQDKIELDEEIKEILDRKIYEILNKIKDKPTVLITYFVPDERKNGGSYEEIKGNVIKIDDYKNVIILENKEEILIENILDIEEISK